MQEIGINELPVTFATVNSQVPKHCKVVYRQIIYKYVCIRKMSSRLSVEFTQLPEAIMTQLTDTTSGPFY